MVTPSVSSISGIDVWPITWRVFVKKIGSFQPFNKNNVPNSTAITRGSLINLKGGPPPVISQTPNVILKIAIIENVNIANSKPVCPKASRQIGIPILALFPKIIGARNV